MGRSVQAGRIQPIVSILVFVELALDDLHDWGVRIAGGMVSILVFVELALDVMVVGYSDLKSSSFNPCFRGTCS